jgi:hypothetical protein
VCWRAGLCMIEDIPQRLWDLARSPRVLPLSTPTMAARLLCSRWRGEMSPVDCKRAASCFVGQVCGGLEHHESYALSMAAKKKHKGGDAAHRVTEASTVLASFRRLTAHSALLPFSFVVPLDAPCCCDFFPGVECTCARAVAVGCLAGFLRKLVILEGHCSNSPAALVVCGRYSAVEVEPALRAHYRGGD